MSDENQDETQRGEMITRSLMIRRGLLEDADQVIEQLEKSSGMKISRSRLISVLLQIVMEHEQLIDGKNIHDEHSLKTELCRAIAK